MDEESVNTPELEMCSDELYFLYNLIRDLRTKHRENLDNRKFNRHLPEHRYGAGIVFNTSRGHSMSIYPHSFDELEIILQVHSNDNRGITLDMARRLNNMGFDVDTKEPNKYPPHITYAIEGDRACLRAAHLLLHVAVHFLEYEPHMKVPVYLEDIELSEEEKITGTLDVVKREVCKVLMRVIFWIDPTLRN
jgi:hypothetical protein